MKTAAALVTALLIASASGQAAGAQVKPSLFQYFMDLCVAHRGDPVGVRDAAIKAGFSDVGPKSDLIYMLMKGDGPGGVSISTMFENEPGTDPEDFSCQLYGGARGTEFADSVAQWVGVSPESSLSDERTTAYMFTVSRDGSHRIVTQEVSGSEEDEIYRAGGLWILLVSSDPAEPGVNFNYASSPRK